MIDKNIKTQGIFRASARIQSIQILMAAYDRGQKFIVWREGNVALASSHRREGIGEVYVNELETMDGFELMAACAIIKHWYKELREPIFPTSSYEALERFFDGTEITLDPPTLLEMLALEDEWSPIASITSRQILRMHLLPMLSKVVENSAYNQMTPENLAICIAPTLLRGPDPVKDMRMSRVVQRILTAMITQWKEHLAPEIGMNGSRFEDSLLMPAATEDRDDPIEPISEQIISETEAQMGGITLIDNDASSIGGRSIGDRSIEEPGPPLPPRRATQISLNDSEAGSEIASIEREGTPPPLPPRPSAVARKPVSIGPSSSTSSLVATESLPGPSSSTDDTLFNVNATLNTDRTPTFGTGSRSRSSTIASFATAAESATSVLDTDAVDDASVSGSTAVNNQTRRKPPPEAIPLPRYSMLFGPGPSNPTAQPAYYNTVAPVDEDGWEQHQGLIYHNEEDDEPPPLYQDTEFSAFTEEHIAITPVTPRAIPPHTGTGPGAGAEQQVEEPRPEEMEPSVASQEPSTDTSSTPAHVPAFETPSTTPSGTVQDESHSAPDTDVTTAPPARLPPPPPPPGPSQDVPANAPIENVVQREVEAESSPWSG